MQIAFPVLVGILAALGDKAVFLVGLGMVVGLGTVVVYRNGFAWMPWQVRTHIAWFKEWALEDSDAAIGALDDIFDGIMYGGSILLVLTFFGYFILKFTEAGNISDIYTLPVFGNIIKSIADALGIAGSLVMIALLLAVMVPVIILVTRISRRVSPSRD